MNNSDVTTGNSLLKIEEEHPSGAEAQTGSTGSGGTTKVVPFQSLYSIEILEL